MLDEWHEGTLAQAKIVQGYADTLLDIEDSYNHVPQNTDQCNAYMTLCQFYDICSAPVDLRATTIQHGYQENAWQPQERSTEKETR
jgi:hypothetical protein